MDQDTMTAEGGNAELLKEQADVIVYVFEVPGEPELLFAIGTAGKKLPPGIEKKGNTLIFDKIDGNIMFGLDDNQSKVKLDFAYDPIWSSAGTDCPTATGNTLLPVIPPVSKKSLTVSNERGADTISYSLQFVDKDGNRHSFDPIIRNVP